MYNLGNYKTYELTAEGKKKDEVIFKAIEFESRHPGALVVPGSNRKHYGYIFFRKSKFFGLEERYDIVRQQFVCTTNGAFLVVTHESDLGCALRFQYYESDFHNIIDDFVLIRDYIGLSGWPLVEECDVDSLADKIRDRLYPEIKLTLAEARVLLFLLKGLSIEKTREKLNLSKSTVRSHRGKIYSAFGVGGRGHSAGDKVRERVRQELERTRRVEDRNLLDIILKL